MISELVLVLVSLLAYFYYKTWKKMRLWSSMGVEEDPGSFPFGSQPNRDLFIQKISWNALFDESYPKYKHLKLWGNYGVLGAPQLVINDLELMKDVLIRDFDYFPSPREFYIGTNKYVNNMLISLKGDKWKAMRTLASPVFTSGKLKGMVPLIDSVGDAFVTHVGDFATADKEFEAKELFTLYSVDVVATMGFGVDAKTLSDPKSVFKDQLDKMVYRGKYLEAGGVLQPAKVVLSFLWTDMTRLLKLEIIQPDATNFFCNIMKSQLEERKKSGKKRNDFIDAMLQGYDQGEKEGADGKIFKDHEDLEIAIVANALVLFFGGFDTTSTSASATAWFLAKNPEIQEALYEEINEAIEANGNCQHLDYDTVQNMPYLEGVMMESLRLYPLGDLERVCEKAYTFKGTNVTVKPGTLIQIPTVSMMKDEAFYDDPLIFDPTRWSKEEATNRNPFLHFTFGHGPRNCIGKRFAMLQNKMAFVRLIGNYKLLPCTRTCEVLKCDPASPGLDVLGGVWVKCEKRN